MPKETGGGRMLAPLLRSTVISDASHCPDTKAGGWAVWIALDGGRKLKRYGRLKTTVDNASIAEMHSVLNGIWLARHEGGARQILVQTDCMAVIHAIRGQGKAASGVLGKTYREAKAEHFSDCAIQTKHVKGHTRKTDSRSWCNRWCDEQAGIKMREWREELRHGNRT